MLKKNNLLLMLLFLFVSLFTPLICRADMGLPFIAIVFYSNPWVVLPVLFLLVVLIEARVIRKMVAESDPRKALLASFTANFLTTLIGLGILFVFPYIAYYFRLYILVFYLFLGTILIEAVVFGFFYKKKAKEFLMISLKVNAIPYAVLFGLFWLPGYGLFLLFYIPAILYLIFNEAVFYVFQNNKTPVCARRRTIAILLAIAASIYPIYYVINSGPLMPESRIRARDRHRMAAFNEMVLAQKKYYGENGKYLESADMSDAIGTYLNPVPKDPGGFSEVIACDQAAPQGAYCALDNTVDPQKFCYYARLETFKPPYYTASHAGNFKRATPPKTLDECAEGSN